MFKCSSLFTSNSCVYCSTRYNECGRIGTKWLLFFFYLYWRNVVLWLKRTSTKKLANRISYQIWYKGCLKGKFGRGVQICEGGPYPLADLDRGRSNSAVTPASSRRQKVSMILQFAPLIDQISVPVLGGFVVPLVDVEDVECLKKCKAMVKVGLSRFQKPIGELASVCHR